MRKQLLILLNLVLFSGSLFAQSKPEVTRGQDNVIAKDYNHKVVNLFELPHDTLSTAATGSLASIDAVVYVKDVLRWKPLSISTVIESGNNSFQVEDSLNAQPVSPGDSTYWLLGGSPTGADWSGHPNEIALWDGAAWSFPAIATYDWALTLDDNVWHQYDGSTWPVQNSHPWNTNGNKGGGILGSTDNSNVLFWRNNVTLLTLQGNGTRFNQMSGTNKGIAYFGQTGIIQRREPVASSDTTNNKPIGQATDGTIYRMSYWPGSGGGTVTPAALTKTDDTNVTLTLGGTPTTALLQATSLTLGWTGSLSIARGGTNNGSLSVTAGTIYYGDGTKLVGLAPGTAAQHLVGGTTPAWKDTTAAGSAVTASNGLNKVVNDIQFGGALTSDVSTSGAFNMTLGSSRFTVNAADSVRIATINSLSLSSAAGLNLWAVGALTARATGVSVSSLSTGFYGSLGVSDSTGLFTQLAGGRIGNYLLGATAFGVGTPTDSILSINTTTKKISYLSSDAFATWITTSPAANKTYLTPKFTATDSVVLGPVSAYGVALLTVNGQTQSTGSMSIGSPNPSTSAMLTLNNAGSTAWTNSINATLTTTNTSGTTAALFTNATSVTNSSSSYYGVRGVINGSNNNFTVGPVWIGMQGFVGIGTSNAGSVTLTSGIALEGTVTITTGNVKAITTAGGLRSFLQANDANPTGKVTDWFGVKADSTNNNYYSGRNRGIWQDGTNATNNIDGLTLFGDPISGTPTAFVHMAAGTTANAQARFTAGVAPSSPNTGDVWYETTNNRFMFRQNATSVEFLGTSAVNSVSPTAPNRTITVVINGTTYYISAKTTND